ncbi:hypothetical protein JIG36_36410 [Actinoplanes sp. LDG1-06]|uniref:Uncharacterized protein n=1 Tax=Paractinoplanes ovalisporus TaxID=2810368 RepID=A0ABS2AMB8_9ACTN|nr:hypothetical protein [Actinoplanes ovalisporus]MBM2620998.1 hypothetical protein [Actinoplanes ovalisporus]
MIRDEVRDFVRLGPLTSELDDSEEGDEAFEEMERALHAIEKPVTDEEARLLLGSFGEDASFGLAWTLLHLIESAPSPPVVSEPPAGANPWIEMMWVRYRNRRAD